MKKMLLMALAAAMMAAPTTASAQFGSMGKKLLGAEGGGLSVSTGDAETFLSNAMRSTKNIMISATLLAQAITDREKLTSTKEQIAAIQNAQDIKELDAYRPALVSNLDILNKNADVAGSFSSAYQAGNVQQKKLMSIAVANLAIGIARNVQLVGQAPGMIKGIGSNPALVSRVGQFKMAAGLLGMQAKGLSGIVTVMPKLLAAGKVKGPAASETDNPQPIVW